MFFAFVQILVSFLSSSGKEGFCCVHCHIKNWFNMATPVLRPLMGVFKVPWIIYAFDESIIWKWDEKMWQAQCQKAFENEKEKKNLMVERWCKNPVSWEDVKVVCTWAGFIKVPGYRVNFPPSLYMCLNRWLYRPHFCWSCASCVL